MKSNLAQYKSNGQFVALVLPHDPYWQTTQGQRYLREFYILREAERCGLINSDEFNVYAARLTNGNKPDPYSRNYHLTTCRCQLCQKE